MNAVLSPATRASATPCLVAAFDELHPQPVDGNATIRKMIDSQPYDPDRRTAIFDSATPVPTSTLRVWFACVAVPGAVALFLFAVRFL